MGCHVLFQWIFLTQELHRSLLQLPHCRQVLYPLSHLGSSLSSAAKLLNHFSRVRLCATPQTAAHQAPPSLGFSRQEHWSGLPFPSPMHESGKWKVKVKSLSRVRLLATWEAVVSNSVRPHGLQPTRLLCLWDCPGKSTGVGCHCLLQVFPQGKSNKQPWYNPSYEQILFLALWK